MKLTDLFHKKQTPVLSYDHERLEPAMRCSICNGEQVAGFKDCRTGAFTEVMLIRTEDDRAEFCRRYGLKPEQIKTVY